MGNDPVAQKAATTALVLGIISIFCCGIVLGPIAMIKAQEARKYGPNGQATAGMILGIVGSVLWILALFLRVTASGAARS